MSKLKACKVLVTPRTLLWRIYLIRLVIIINMMNKMIAVSVVMSSVIIFFIHHLSYSYSFFPSIFESVKTTSIGQEV